MRVTEAEIAKFMEEQKAVLEDSVTTASMKIQNNVKEFHNKMCTHTGNDRKMCENAFILRMGIMMGNFVRDQMEKEDLT